MSEPLEGRRAFVTGASSGIGLAAARALAAAGCEVALCARRLNILKEQAAALGTRGFALRGDVRDFRSMQIAADHVKKKWSTAPDILVVNAGMVATAPLAEMEPEKFRDVIDTNLTGAFHTCRAFVPDMLAAGGDIVLVASVASYATWETWGAYCASKWGLLAMARTLAEEVRRKGLRVSILAPGAVDTEIWPEAQKPDPAKMLRADDVGAAVVQAVSAPKHVSFDEVRILPASGLL